MVEISLSGISSGKWNQYQDDVSEIRDGNYLLTLEQYELHQDIIANDGSNFALVIESNVNEKRLHPLLSQLRMIELVAPSFADGRVFTQARSLRDIGFKGEIKVSGPVIPDQAKFFARVGVDTLIVEDASRTDDFIAVLERYKIYYQSSADGIKNIPKLRHDKNVKNIFERKAS